MQLNPDIVFALETSLKKSFSNFLPMLFIQAKVIPLLLLLLDDFSLRISSKVNSDPDPEPSLKGELPKELPKEPPNGRLGLLGRMGWIGLLGRMGWIGLEGLKG